MPLISQRHFYAMPDWERTILITSHLLVGTQPDTGDLIFIPDIDRYSGMYVLGVQGAGKSGFLQNLIHHDETVGNAVIVIDPHGDLVDDCLAAVPPNRLERTYVIDLEDEAYPFGVNLFAVGNLDSSLKRTQAVERIVHIFDVLWPEIATQQYIPLFLPNVVQVFLDNPGTTLVDMLKFFKNDAYRARLLQNVKDPTIREFWADEYDSRNESERQRRVQPLTNRLQTLFTGHSLVRNILGQSHTTISFRRAIEEKQIILIKLPTKNARHVARLVGTIILTQIHAALFSFADTLQSERPGVSVYMDEFQNFATSDIEELFSEGRKYGIRLTVAHQRRDQLPTFLQKATLSARTTVCFQLNPDDGGKMADVFPAQHGGVDEPHAHAAKYLLEQGVDDRYAEEFTETYLRPLREQRSGKRIEIRDPGWSVGKVVTILAGPKKPEKVYAPDPMPYLDNLLHQVMKTGNPHLDIPREAVEGFSNCTWHGFYQQAIHARWELTSKVTFPLVVDRGRGPEWIRRPQDGHEQFLHFIFLLRMTMLHLAENPVGKSSTPSSTAVGQMLTQLPKRGAFIRSGDLVDMLYTADTPPRLNGEEFGRRLHYIRQQTRAKYCHPRAEIEGSSATPPAQLSQVSEPTSQGTAAPTASAASGAAGATIDSNQASDNTLSWLKDLE